MGDDLDIIAEANPAIEVVRLLNRDVDVCDARLIGYAVLKLRVETRTSAIVSAEELKLVWRSC